MCIWRDAPHSPDALPPSSTQITQLTAWQVPEFTPCPLSPASTEFHKIPWKPRNSAEMGKFRGLAQNSAFCGKLWSLIITGEVTVNLLNFGCVLFENLTNLDRSKRNAPHSQSNPDLLRHVWENMTYPRPSVLLGVGIVCLLVKEGVVFGALCRWEQDDPAHYDPKDLQVLFHRTGSISSDKSRSI